MDDGIGETLVSGSAYRSAQLEGIIQSIEQFFLLLVKIQFNDSALRTDSYHMGSVVGAQLGEYVRHVAFHRRLADRELIGNELV